MAEKFGKSPAIDYLGIRDPAVAMDLDFAAWGLLTTDERRAKRIEDMNARIRNMELAYMVGTVFAGKEIPPITDEEVAEDRSRFV